MNPQRGEIYWLPFGAGKERPVVIVSRDTLNGGDNVIVVPFTTVDVNQRAKFPNYVVFGSGEAGLPKDCVAKADEITLIAKSKIDFTRKIGRIPAEKMTAIVNAIRWTVRDDSFSSP